MTVNLEAAINGVIELNCSLFAGHKVTSPLAPSD